MYYACILETCVETLGNKNAHCERKHRYKIVQCPVPVALCDVLLISTMFPVCALEKTSPRTKYEYASCKPPDRVRSIISILVSDICFLDRNIILSYSFIKN